VALVTLSLALSKEGSAYVSVEGRSMALGALAFAIYSVVVCHLLMRLRWPAWMATSLALIPWLVIALCAERLFVR
jgi:hypothetical protein